MAFGQWFARQRWYLGGIAGFGQFVSLNLDSVDAMGNPVNTDPLRANFRRRGAAFFGARHRQRVGEWRPSGNCLSVPIGLGSRQA